MEPQTIDPFDKNLQMMRAANEAAISNSGWYSERAATSNSVRSMLRSDAPRQIVPSYIQSSMLSMLPEERPFLIVKNPNNSSGNTYFSTNPSSLSTSSTFIEL